MNLHGPSNCVDRRDTFITHQKKKFRQSFKPEEPAGYIVNEEDLTSTLFRGVRVYFQGFLEKYSDFHLKKLISAHGGKVKCFFSIKDTTHVVCSNLSCSKLHDMIDRNGNSKTTIKVVSPKWIVDSIEKKTLLPESEYTILPTSNSLTNYFEKKKTSNLENNTPRVGVKRPLSFAPISQKKKKRKLKDIDENLEKDPLAELKSQNSLLLSKIPKAQTLKYSSSSFISHVD